jgi:hypothetical protein
MIYDSEGAKQANETRLLDVDFHNSLSPSVTVVSAVIKVYKTSDWTDVTNSILEGSYNITTGRGGVNTRLTQLLKAGTDGDEYDVQVRATTSDDQVIEHDHLLSIEKKGKE